VLNVLRWARFSRSRAATPPGGLRCRLSGGPRVEALLSCWRREATEADRQGARLATSKAARTRPCEAYWGNTAGAPLCFFDQTSKIFQF
jgi:hypothetical protein